MPGRTALWAAGGAIVALLAGRPVRAGVITPRLESVLQAAGGGEVPVIIRIPGTVDLGSFRDPDRRRRRQVLIRALRAQAGSRQASVVAFLRSRAARRVAPLWIVNGVAVLARPGVIRALAGRLDVEQIDVDATLGVPDVGLGTQAAAEWNLDAVGAPEIWGLGFIGQQRVVASMDTGVDLAHPDIGPKWRGGANSWFDPNAEHSLPVDVDGHGTWTMGLMVGGTAGGTAIGVAPGAQWIAVKIFNDAGVASLSGVHQGFQWLLDPDGNPATDDAPDVVSNSWTFGTAGTCEPEFAPDVHALETAGIAVVFAAGNYGPGSTTSVSPANYSESLGVGAVDTSWSVPAFSSRGPSACDGGVFPRVVAPGVSVRTSDLTFGGLFPNSFAYVSGTSFAAPHVAGGLALLGSAFPAATAAELEAAVEGTALDLAPVGPDDGAGYGLLDLPAAYGWLQDRVGTTTTTTISTSSTTSPPPTSTTTTSTTTTSTTTTSTSTTLVPPTIFERRVSASSNDAEQRVSNGSVNVTSTVLDMVHNGNYLQMVGMRFVNVTVPNGATIHDAWIQFRASGTSSGALTLTIRGQLATNALTFTTSTSNISNRTLTSASQTWSPPNWSSSGATGANQRTPTLAAIIQQIVNQGGWTSGNALAIIMTGPSGRRAATSYNGSSSGAPLLHIEYTPGGPTTTTTSTTTTTVPSSPLIATVLADVAVDSSVPGSNLGTQNQLHADAGPTIKRTFIRVQVSNVLGRTVTSAVLTLRVATTSNAQSVAGGQIHLMTDCSWGETSTNYNNQPSIGGAAFATLGAVNQGQLVTFNVTTQVPGDGTYCFAIDSSSTDGVDFESRETSSAANRPQFIVQVG